MKINVFLFCLIVFATITVATPVLELERTTLQPRETLIGKIYTAGNFLEQLSKEDIKFYSGQKREYFEHGLYYYNNAYYLYVIFNKEGTFTIKTDEILYNLVGEVGSKAISQTITVKYENNENSSEPANLLSIEPGVIYTLADSAQLKLFNRGSSDLSITAGESSFTIPAYQAKLINLNLLVPLSYVKIASYKTFSIPVIYLGAKVYNDTKNETNSTPEIITSDLLVKPTYLEFNTTINQSISEEIELINLGNGSVTSIFLKNNLSMAIVEVPYSVESKESGYIKVDIFSGQKSRNETIELSYIEKDTEFNISIPIYINIETLNQTITQNQTTSPKITCQEQGGILCDGNCDGKSNFTSDGYCCYGNCVPFSSDPSPPQTQEKSYGWVLGLLIFLVIAIIGYGVFTKYKKTSPEAPDKKMDSTSKRFEKRMKGSLSRD